MTRPNTTRTGRTRQGKTLAAARDAVEETWEARVILDPHKQSLAETVLTHVTGNVLFDRLSNIKTFLPFDFVIPSTDPDPDERFRENDRNAEYLAKLLLRRRDSESMAHAPLMEEYVMGGILLYLSQPCRKPLSYVPMALMPGTPEFESLVKDCTRPDIKHKFQQFGKLTPRGQRAEAGSAIRLINGVFHSKEFLVRSGGGFSIGRHLDNAGVLIIERGDEISDDAMRVIMGAIILLVINHAKRRPKPYPIIRCCIDEVTNAGLFGPAEMKGLAETNKNGLYWDLLDQTLAYPGGAENVLQNCGRHEWYGCASYDLARKAAVDICTGLDPEPEESRAELLARITRDVMRLKPGERWVCERDGTHKEYVPMLKNPWPDWPGLREARFEEKLACIYRRTEYQKHAAPTSANGSSPATPPPPKSPGGSFSPAVRWKQREKKPIDGSAKNGSEAESASGE